MRDGQRYTLRCALIFALTSGWIQPLFAQMTFTYDDRFVDMFLTLTDDDETFDESDSDGVSQSNTQRLHTAHRPNHGFPSSGTERLEDHSTRTSGRASAINTLTASSTALRISSSLRSGKATRAAASASSTTRSEMVRSVDVVANSRLHFCQRTTMLTRGGRW